MAYVVIRDPRTNISVQPTKVYVDISEAETEAKRLATQHKGILFLVAKFVSGAEIPREEAKIVKYDGIGGRNADPWDSDQCPF